MAPELGSGIHGPGLHDALVILGAAGIVIPAFARLRISPVIGFILVGVLVGPSALGIVAADLPWLALVTITDTQGIEPFAELGIILLLFAIGLELSFRRLFQMRRQVFGIGAGELAGSALLIGGVLLAMGNSIPAAALLGVALAMSSTALVVPIAGMQSAVGRSAFAMLLFEDLALVPLVFVFTSLGGDALARLGIVALKGIAVVAAMLIVGRFLLPRLFAQAARIKNPELFLSVSLVTVIVGSLVTAAVGLSPLLGALIAGLLVAETEYRSEVEVVTAPLRGLALGVFLITVGLRLDLQALAAQWPELLLALVAVIAIKAVVTGGLLRISGSRSSTATETGLLMASPSETTLILLGAGASMGLIRPESASFWEAVTALGLTITPILAKIGRWTGRKVDSAPLELNDKAVAGRTVIFGFGRVGHMVSDMLAGHKRPYIAVENDIDTVKHARADGYEVLFGDVARLTMIERLNLNRAAALVLTMDDPVLTVRLARRVRQICPDLPIVARARDTSHAAQLYLAGATDAVPETLEASLQLSEAVLVDLGLAMGPVIASIHDKRDQLRAKIKAEAKLEEAPRLGRRLRDAQPSEEGSNRNLPAT